MTIAPALLGALSVVAAGATVIGTVVNIAGQAAQTSANVNAANYQAMVAENNAKIQQENANRAIARSQQEQEDQDRKSAYLYGTLVANQGASGLSLGGRSFMLTRKSARELGRLDAENVRQAGEIDAYNYKTMSADSAQAAEFAHSQAGSSLLEGAFGMAGSLIGGVAKLGSSGALSPKIGSAYKGGWGSEAFA